MADSKSIPVTTDDSFSKHGNPFFDDEDPEEVIGCVINVLECFRGILAFNPMVLETIAHQRGGADALYLILGSLTHALQKAADDAMYLVKPDAGNHEPEGRREKSSRKAAK